MSSFEIISVIISLTAALAYLNERFLKLPSTIGLMALSLIFSALLLLAKASGLPLGELAIGVVSKIDFHDTLMNGMLSSLLFAGSLHVEISSLSKNKVLVTVLSTLGLVLSTIIVGVSAYFLFAFFKIDVSLTYCLIFGALISPTDPIAVLALLKSSHAPKDLHTQIAGEALFNDGVAVVVFITLSGLIASHSADVDIARVLKLFSQEALGGMTLGALIGLATSRLLRSAQTDAKTEIILTLAVVTGGYALANRLHTSGPIAMVVAGLFIGNRGNCSPKKKKSRENLEMFWEMIDEILNSTLFVLIGLELLVISFSLDRWLISLLFIPIVLLARWFSVAISFICARKFGTYAPNSIQIITWGGLRGGLSVALALSLPEGNERIIIVCATYVVVLFAVLVQGMTFSILLRPLNKTVESH